MFTAGDDKQELLFNLGLNLTDHHRIILSAGQLQQQLNFDFLSGKTQARVKQNNLAASYQYLLGQGLLSGMGLDAWLANTPSRNLSDKTWATDTTTQYELWNDARRIAGGQTIGLQGNLTLTPIEHASLKLGLGAERLEWHQRLGNDSTVRATGSAEWRQILTRGAEFKVGINANAAQNRYTTGISRPLGGGRLGLDLTHIQGRDSTQNDTLAQLNYTWNLGASNLGTSTAMGRGSNSPDQASNASANEWASNNNEAATNPAVGARTPPQPTPPPAPCLMPFPSAPAFYPHKSWRGLIAPPRHNA
ncbi:MAG: hypothetical protein FJY53_06065 [Betaproteobacteria bacterium]|nr:hypothetical protein [Betaproteobacteria bacterium]